MFQQQQLLHLLVFMCITIQHLAHVIAVHIIDHIFGQWLVSYTDHTSAMLIKIISVKLLLRYYMALVRQENNKL